MTALARSVVNDMFGDHEAGEYLNYYITRSER